MSAKFNSQTQFYLYYDFYMTATVDKIVYTFLDPMLL